MGCHAGLLGPANVTRALNVPHFSIRSLIKRRFYWPNMQKDVESWCQRCAVYGRCKAAVRGHGQLQQSTYGVFKGRVSVDLMGPFKRTQDGN